MRSAFRYKGLVTDSMGHRLVQLFMGAFPDSTLSIPTQRKADFSPMQVSTLQTVAAQCPYEYGPGVHMARAMLSEFDTIPYFGYNECEVGHAPPSGKADGGGNVADGSDDGDAPDFSLYPNPNTGEFTVMTRLEVNDRAEIAVQSVSGQLIHTAILSNGANKLKLDVANGLYLYTVSVNEEVKWSGKVSIVFY